MKKTIIPILALLATACVAEKSDISVSVGNGREITVTATAGEPDTRTERSADGAVLWSPGDQISLFYGSGADGGSCFTAQNTEVAATANFTGTISVITCGNDVSLEDTWFWATYPYSPAASCDGSSITTVLPSTQVAKANTFADNTFPSIGRSEGLDMGFYNICGGLKITISEPDLKSITLQGNNGEVLAGTITAAFDDSGVPVVTNIENGSTTVTVSAPDGETLQVGTAYYIVIVPTVFENGFSLTFRKANYMQAVYNRTDKVNIRRSRFGALSGKDTGQEWSIAPSITFPDPNFNAYMMKNFDTNANGVLDLEEAQAVTNISVTTDNIETLEGIAYCSNLKSLYCNGSIGSKGKLTSIDVSSNYLLTELYCYNNQLTTLDVSSNTALQKLHCYGNQLTFLDVSSNTSLTNLSCYFNQLTFLDVSSNTALTELRCTENQLTSLDVSKNTALSYLNCGSNQLAILDVSSNTELTDLYCGFNYLTSLDVSANTSLTFLDCSFNPLTSFDVSSNTALTHLNCTKNQLTSLDVSKNTALSYLNCDSNNLTSLDVGQNTALNRLYCLRNKLTILKVSRNTALAVLDCNSNQLTSLDVSNNPFLAHLDCYGNQLTSLDVSNNPVLFELDCSPMNDDSGNNLLANLTVAEVATIPNVTHNRNDNYIPATTVISSVPIVFTIAVPEAVDLGLNVKWASFNVGATKPQEYGYYYAWGETEPKYYYNWSAYKWCNGSNNTLTKYNTKNNYGTVDNKTVLDPDDDVAHVKLGGKWRMPTLDEYEELLNCLNCSWQWTDNYNNTGIKGYVVTGKKTGYTDKTIFFPAAGLGGLYYTMGNYWSSSINTRYPDSAYEVIFGSSNNYGSYCTRDYGLSVRPVTE